MTDKQARITELEEEIKRLKKEIREKNIARVREEREVGVLRTLRRILPALEWHEDPDACKNSFAYEAALGCPYEGPEQSKCSIYAGHYLVGGYADRRFQAGCIISSEFSDYHTSGGEESTVEDCVKETISKLYKSRGYLVRAALALGPLWPDHADYEKEVEK